MQYSNKQAISKLFQLGHVWLLGIKESWKLFASYNRI